MNSFERIVSTVAFQEADRVPVIAQVFGHAATVAGVPIGDYVRSGEKLAQCQLAALRRYGYDAVFAVMDVNVETEAVGSTLRYRENQYPSVDQFFISAPNAWNRLRLPDTGTSGRMPEVLKALGILRRELKDTALVVGCVLGPLTLASQLLGLEKTLYLAIDDPARFECLMDFAADVIIRFGKAQLQAGAHLPMIFDPSASPAVIPPGFFREFELPRLKRVFAALADAGALGNWLHIAGPVKPILPYYAEAGATIANFDYCVAASEVKTDLPKTCLDGNIKSLAFVEEGPAEIEAESTHLIQTFSGRNGFILSSGCEIPPEASPENVAAMVNAARSMN